MLWSHDPELLQGSEQYITGLKVYARSHEGSGSLHLTGGELVFLRCDNVASVAFNSPDIFDLYRRLNREDSRRDMLINPDACPNAGDKDRLLEKGRIESCSS